MSIHECNQRTNDSAALVYSEPLFVPQVEKTDLWQETVPNIRKLVLKLVILFPNRHDVGLSIHIRLSNLVLFVSY